MIDPDNFTNYELDDRELQEYIIFCILVAGKRAHTIKLVHQYLMDTLIAIGGTAYPLDIIHDKLNTNLMSKLLLRSGCGCFNQKARTLVRLADMVHDGLNLRRCEPGDLESIWGIGPKTSRYFILHTRRYANVAVLDRHILRWLREEIGYTDVPDRTPSDLIKYRAHERRFLIEARRLGMTAAELDLVIWKKYRKGEKGGIQK